MYALISQHAEEDLTREAENLYEDTVEPTQTGIVSRLQKLKIIQALK
jgi:hypothetical protein